MRTSPSALSPYETLAEAYDDLTSDHRYDEWLDTLEALAIAHGLVGREVLDVACGTGKSFLPLLARGYRVVGCDLSPAMAALAAAKAPEAEIHVADMRRLQVEGRRFDLVTCLDDALNHLPDEAALLAAFEAAAAALRPGGVYVFDVNTERAFAEVLGVTWCKRTGERMFVWEPRRDEAAPEREPGRAAGRRCEGTLHVFAERGEPEGGEGGEGRWSHDELVLAERHFPQATVRAALEAAGLECLGAYGMQFDGRLRPQADELRDTKAIYVARPRVEREGR